MDFIEKIKPYMKNKSAINVTICHFDSYKSAINNHDYVLEINEYHYLSGIIWGLYATNTIPDIFTFDDIMNSIII